MKTFADLEFKPHRNFENGKQGLLFFPNGYGASVVNGRGSYTNGIDEWELAVLIGNEEKFGLCYETDITDDVLGHLKQNEVDDILKKIQELPSTL